MSRKPQQSEDTRQPGCALDESTRRQYLQAMGIQPWYEKNPAPEAASPVDLALDISTDAPAAQQSAGDAPASPVESLAPAGEVALAVNSGDIAAMDWQQLQQAVSQCRLCELHHSRTQTVFGVGNQQADLLVIGEAPGAEEDRQGEPFVGRAGKLLDAMMQAIQLDRSSIYIANVLKCRPPDNRNPHTSEIVCCDAYLQRQIELIQPKVILALGRIAAHHLLVSQESLGKLRQQNHSYNGIPLVVSYHPAYLLRKPADKRKSWQDLLKVKKQLHA